MSVSWGVYLGVVLPLSVVVGVASAAVGFTAFLVLVPLLFAGFGFHLYEAILVSVLVDAVLGAGLAAFYAIRDRRLQQQQLLLQPRLRLRGSGSTNQRVGDDYYDEAAEALVGAAAHSSSSASSSSGSLSGGVRVGASSSAAAAATAAAAALPERSPLKVRHALLLGLVSVCVQIPMAVFVSAKILLPHSDLLKSGAGYLSFAFALFFLVKAFFQRRKLLSNNKAGAGAGAGVAGEGDGVHEAGEAEEEGESTGRRVLRIVAAVVGAMAFGVMSGVVGVGGGTAFVMVYVIVLGFEVLTATATGCLSMAINMTVQSVLLISGLVVPSSDIDLRKTIPYALVAIAGAAVGAIGGVLLTTRLANWKLTVLVAVVLFVMGALETAQSILLKRGVDV